MKKRLEPRFWYELAIASLGIIVIVICSGRILEAYDQCLIPMDMFVIIAAIIMRTPGMILMLIIILTGLILYGTKHLIS